MVWRRIARELIFAFRSHGSQGAAKRKGFLLQVPAVIRLVIFSYECF